MEINLGDLGISPAMMRKFQENYAKGIAAPKKVKKTKKAAPKKPAGRKRGQPVGGRGIDVKAPKPVAAIKPPKPKPGRRRTRAEIEAPEAVRFGRKGTKTARPVGKAPVAAKSPKPGLKNLTDPSVRQKLKDLFGDADPIKTSQFPEYPTSGSGGILPRASSMPRTGQPGGPQPGTGFGDGPTSSSGGGSFESAYIDWMESEPKAPPVRRGMSVASKAYKEQKKQYATDLEAWKASKPARATYSAPALTTAPAPTTAPIAPPQPPMPDKFEGRYVPQGSILGTPDMSISSNIVGQSYDPSFAESFKQPPQPPGSTFGGYGGQAPMQALNPYAGMAQNNPQPTDFFPTYIPRPAPVYEPLPDQGNTQSDAQPVMNQQSQKPLLSQNPGSSRYGADGIRTYRR